MSKIIVRIVSVVLGIAGVFSLLVSVAILAGLLVGYLVNFLFPAVNLGSAVIAGMIAVTITAYCFTQLVELVVKTKLAQDEDDDQEYEPELLSEDQIDSMVDQISEAMMMKMGERRSRQTASSRKRRQPGLFMSDLLWSPKSASYCVIGYT